MKIELLYGRRTIELILPGDLDVHRIEKHPMPLMADERQTIKDAFNTPVESPALSSLAAGKTSACILICDITRPVPNCLILEPLIDTLIHAGIPISIDRRFIDADLRTRTCVEYAENLEQAVLESVKAHSDKTVAVIPEGPYVVPRYQQ